MKKNVRFTIRAKMLTSFTFVILLLIATGLIGIFYVGDVYNNGKDIYENDLKAVEYLKSISENLKELDTCTFHIIMDVDWEQDKASREQVDALIEENGSLMDSYSQLDISEKEVQLYEQGMESVLQYHEQIREILSMKDLADSSKVLQCYRENLIPIQNSTVELIDAAVDLAISNAEDANETNQNIYNKIVWIICSFMIFAVLVAVAISYKMSEHIASKLKAIQLMAKRMSEYNISDDIEGMERDEFGVTAEALNESQFMVRELMEKIIDESTIISDMGEEVSLAVRKSEQRIEHVNVSMLEYEKLAGEVEEQVKHIVEDRSMSQEEKQALAVVRAKLDEAKVVREQARTELSGIAIYLEQIGITSDYQNEIANSHKEQVRKFKVKERED